MSGFGHGGQFRKSLGQGHGQLKAEKRLRAGNNI
jgi:hypothetical protein